MAASLCFKNREILIKIQIFLLKKITVFPPGQSATFRKGEGTCPGNRRQHLFLLVTGSLHGPCVANS